jgi:hypothetical protein
LVSFSEIGMEKEGMVVGIEESVAIVGCATEVGSYTMKDWMGGSVYHHDLMVVQHFIYIALASQAKMTMYNK